MVLFDPDEYDEYDHPAINKHHKSLNKFSVW